MRTLAIVFFHLFMFVFHQISYGHAFELVIKITNLPNPKQVTLISAQSVDIIYDEYFNPTSEWSGGTIKTDSGSTQDGFDWFTDLQTAQVQLAYSIYKITCNNAYFYINYYDCEYMNISGHSYTNPDIQFEFN